MNRKIMLLAALGGAMAVGAQNTDVTSVRYAGPFPLQKPFMMDSVDVNTKKFGVESLLDLPLSTEALQSGTLYKDKQLPGSSTGYAAHLLGFRLENTAYASGKLKVKGIKHYKAYVDGREYEGGTLKLNPAVHPVVVKYVSEPGNADSLQISFDAPNVKVTTDDARFYTLADVLHGTRVARVSVSPDGKYLISSYVTTRSGGESSSRFRVTELGTGRIVAERTEPLYWMPRTNQFYYTRKGISLRQLVLVNPATGTERVWVDNLPEGRFTVAPTEDYLVYLLTQEGPKEKKEIFQVLVPDDRQPGWRTRSSLAKYDIKTGVMQPLTFGYHNASLLDISRDGRSILFMTSVDRLTQRPTTLYSLYKMDATTLQTELLVDKDGFMSDANFSPDGRQVLLAGSPEAFGGVGANVDEGQTPSMVDTQLYLMDLSDKKITPLTRDFNPNVSRTQWSVFDGQIYFNAENRDCISLYRLNPKNGQITQLKAGEELVNGFSLADKSAVIAYYGQSASNSDRLYTMNSKTQQSTLVEDVNREQLAGIELGECKAWDFVNSRGDTICGRYYLPPHFDATKKYPMIVNYYGGCSPTSRNFESRYPHHAYAALGYVVYVVEPSGATGFGQKFSARHVETAGQGPAEDIIEGTRQFCKEHAFVNDKKIGCIGASYGGFMTQYLQTKTDLFAAAISHAGISDHTSYWGEGYWGYSYSEVSMGDSYPWNATDLYVKQSPLYNADKIHTPLLFVHGTADNNVPVGESIQLFTALKLLGRETAMVLVDGQDHHIVDYGKRVQWQNTIFAWFAKWLQDDSSWWNALYSPKSL